MNNEEAFLSSTFCEFIKCWRSGTKARVIIESMNGHAFVNFSAFLGYPEDAHFNPRPSPSRRKPSGGPRKKSAKKIQRDNDRAARYQERKREGAASAPDKSEEAVVTSSPGAESAMTLSGLEFSFASPVPETLRQTSNDDISTSMILIDSEEQNEQNEQNVQNVQETQKDKKGEKQSVYDEDRKHANEESDQMCEHRCQRHTREVLEEEKCEKFLANPFLSEPQWKEQIIAANEFMKMKQNEIANCENCANILTFPK